MYLNISQFLLLHAGSNPVAEDNNHNTPLHLACLGGHEGVRRFIYVRLNLKLSPL